MRSSVSQENLTRITSHKAQGMNELVVSAWVDYNRFIFGEKIAHSFHDDQDFYRVYMYIMLLDLTAFDLYRSSKIYMDYVI